MIKTISSQKSSLHPSGRCRVHRVAGLGGRGRHTPWTICLGTTSQPFLHPQWHALNIVFVFIVIILSSSYSSHESSSSDLSHQILKSFNLSPHPLIWGQFPPHLVASQSFREILDASNCNGGRRSKQFVWGPSAPCHLHHVTFTLSPSPCHLHHLVNFTSFIIFSSDHYLQTLILLFLHDMSPFKSRAVMDGGQP